MPQIQCTSILGNSQLLDGGAMFGNAPRTVWEKWIKPDSLGRIPLACRALLLEIDQTKILCETGIGAFFDPKMASRFGVQNSDRHILRENLRAQGIEPQDIDFVILSHLHFDHAGGLLPTFKEMEEGDEELIFPKARFVVGEEAWQRALNPHPRDRASFIPGLTDKLKKSNRLIIVKGTTAPELPSLIQFFISHGHTPGQMLTQIKVSNKTLIFTGDLVPGVHWVHLPITMGYDRFPELVIDEKQKLYSTFDLSTTWFFYTHDSEFACSQIQKDETGKYVPVHSKHDGRLDLNNL